MPSFTSLLKYAALGFAATTSVYGAPIPDVASIPALSGLGLGSGSLPVSGLTGSSDTGSLSSLPVVGSLSGLGARHYKALPSIVTDLSGKLTGCLMPLKFATSDNATAANITPIIGEAKTLITAALADVKLVAGGSVETALSTSGGVLGLFDFAGLLCALITIVFSACAQVIACVSSVNQAACFASLCELLVCFAGLLQVILGCVSGLLAILLPLVFSVMSGVCGSLKIGGSFSFMSSSFAI